MAKSNYFWTDEEDNLIIQAVKKSPKNLQEVFRGLSTRMDRSASSISQRYYSVLHNPNHEKYAGVLFTLVGFSEVYVGKNCTPQTINQPVKCSKSTWDKITKLLGL